MLKFVIAEWSNKESILFKGFNMSQEICDNDTKEIIRDKIKHNAVYSLYYNIIRIAYLFKIKHSFYLSTQISEVEFIHYLTIYLIKVMI